MVTSARRNRGQRARGPQSGFTLIELLVVIAVITLLAAILFPVFSRVRENARRAACLSNARQLGLGLMQYNQDYDGRFPTMKYGGDSVANGYQTWDDAVYPYVRSNNVYICPNAYEDNTRTYSMNIFVAGWTNNFGGTANANVNCRGGGTWNSYGYGADPGCIGVTTSGIPQAANTVLLVESYTPQKLDAAACTTSPLTQMDCYNRRGQSQNVTLFGRANIATAPWGFYTGNQRDTGGTLRDGPGRGVHIGDTFVDIFSDGHAKALRPVPPTDGSYLYYPGT